MKDKDNDPDNDIEMMQDTFGPRYTGESYNSDQPYNPNQPDPFDSKKFKFHRGIDIPTGVDTPVLNTDVLAILDGKLEKIVCRKTKSDNHLQYRVEIKHANRVKSFWSTYHHLNSFNSALCPNGRSSQCSEDGTDLQCGSPTIAQGTVIGTSGYDNDQTFSHLHFEIRDAQGDTGTSRQKHSVHPLRVLPYPATQLPTMTCASPMTSKVTCKLEMDRNHQDLTRVELLVLNSGCDLAMQDKWTSVYDYELFNVTFSHTLNEWNSQNSCPFDSEHAGSYDLDFHLGNYKFNYVEVMPQPFTKGSMKQEITFKFTKFASGKTILVRAWNIKGKFTEARMTVP